MLETGLVVELEGDFAVVEFERGSMCEKCGACIKAGPSQMQVKLPNSLHAAVGSRVSVQMAQRNFLQAAAIAYGVPLLALLAGLALFTLLGCSELVTALGSIALSLAAYGVIHLAEPKLRKNQKFAHQMVEIVE